jgi:hypothetical protein
MKKLITAIVASFISLGASAQALEAKPFQDIVSAIQNADFHYQDRGMVFGFDSIQSCTYVSEEIVIVKNYCFPVRKYPARGYTIISKKFGMIDLYEEKIDDLLKRDIQITQFPEVMAPYLTTSLPQMTTEGLSGLIQKMYYKFYPACWSTSFSFYTESPDTNCSVSTEFVQGFDGWAKETQTILLDETSWLELVKAIDGKLTPIQ